MMVTNADIRNDASRTAQISMRVLIFRGLLLLVLAYLGNGYIQYGIFWLYAGRGMGLYAGKIPLCLFYSVLGFFACFLFQPRGYVAAAAWLVCCTTIIVGPHAALNGPSILLQRWSWHYWMIAPLIVAGYGLGKLLSGNFKVARRFELTLFWIVIVGNAVLLGILSSYYVSPRYWKAMKMDLPVYEKAQEMETKRSWGRGLTSLTFTSDPGKARDIFNFFDATLAEKGFVRFEEPQFESRTNFAVSDEMKEKLRGSEFKLSAKWIDRPNKMLVDIFAISKYDPDGDRDKTERIHVYIAARPFLSIDERFHRVREESRSDTDSSHPVSENEGYAHKLP